MEKTSKMNDFTVFFNVMALTEKPLLEIEKKLLVLNRPFIKEGRNR